MWQEIPGGRFLCATALGLADRDQLVITPAVKWRFFTGAGQRPRFVTDIAFDNSSEKNLGQVTVLVIRGAILQNR
jgi:hypothetical protein